MSRLFNKKPSASIWKNVNILSKITMHTNNIAKGMLWHMILYGLNITVIVFSLNLMLIIIYQITRMESMFDIYVEIFIYIEPHDIVYIKTYFKRNMLSMNMSNIFTSGSKILPRKNHVSNNRPILLLAKMFAANQTSIVIFDFLCSLITLSSHTLQWEGLIKN